MTIDSSKGVWTLSGVDMSWVDFPVLHATSADETLAIDGSYDAEIYGGPMAVAYLGGGDDQIYGDGAIVYGGSGDDNFVNSGHDLTQGLYAESHGGSGNDTFVVFYGSTKYFGGAGRDIFTNGYGVVHSFDGDHDIVDLGKGDDIAHWLFDFFSGSGGLFLDPRQAELAGGDGIDTLELDMSNGNAQIWDQSSIDFGALNHGALTIGNALISDFEVFNLRFGSSRLSEVNLGRFSDNFEWFDTNGDSEAGALVLRGGRGADHIVGSLDRHDERIYGGGGNDIITGGGGPSDGIERLFGGSGDDFLYAKGITDSVGTPKLMMSGGAGDDIFVVSGGEGSRIQDFEQGHDRIGLDFTGRYSINHDLFGAGSTHWRNLVIQRDDASALVFQFDAKLSFYNRTYEVKYNHNTGKLWLREEGEVWGDPIAKLLGNPDLTVDDFMVIEWDML